MTTKSEADLECDKHPKEQIVRLVELCTSSFESFRVVSLAIDSSVSLSYCVIAAV